MGLRTWIRAHYDEAGPVQGLAFALDLVTALALMTLMLITCIDVVGRYFFNSPLTGSSEMTEVFIAVVVFAQMPRVTWRGGHVVVDVLDHFVPSVWSRLCACITVLLVSGSFFGLGLRVWELAERSLKRGEATEYLAIPVGHVVQYIALMSWITAATMLVYGFFTMVCRPGRLRHRSAEGEGE